MEDKQTSRSAFRGQTPSVGSKLGAGGKGIYEKDSKTLNMGDLNNRGGDGPFEDAKNRDLKSKIRCVSCATLTIFFITLILVIINFGFTIKLWSLTEQIHEDLNGVLTPAEALGMIP